MIYVPDTNNLLRFANRADVQHAVVLSAVRKLKNGGDKIHILPQTCIEFWNVCTRPTSRNGFGLTVPQANHSLRLVEKIFPLLPDNARVHQQWRKLVLDFGVSGVQVHDARIVSRNACSSDYAYFTFQHFGFHPLFKHRHHRYYSKHALILQKQTRTRQRAVSQTEFRQKAGEDWKY